MLNCELVDRDGRERLLALELDWELEVNAGGVNRPRDEVSV
ncbi:hypothetical protein [Rhodopirellula bahusiensis]|nr:hypothetical protein [Rhodopirellula bahusiensis]